MYVRRILKACAKTFRPKSKNLRRTPLRNPLVYFFPLDKTKWSMEANARSEGNAV